MDNVTHALAGCLLAAATVSVMSKRGVAVPRRFASVATAVGLICAELPDADLVYAGRALGIGKLGYMLHHRGHTHTVVFALVAAVVVWLVVLALRRDMRAAPFRNSLLVLALMGTFSHLALDFSNNYGIHPFWPVLNTWYYGDAVFIVEPWLWIIAIPPLLLFYQGRIARALLVLLLLIILAAAWMVGLVGRDVALAFTVGTAVWAVLIRIAPPPPRIAIALVAWLTFEVMFFAASARARRVVHSASGDTKLLDVALTPNIGNAFCFSALVVDVVNEEYRVSDAVVASFPALRSAQNCSGRARGGVPDASPSTRASTRAVQWGGEWRAPAADLRRIASTNCEVAAALEFIRVPVWRQLTNGDVEIGDVRFGGSGDFAGLTASARPSMCPRYVPGWTPPRVDVLRVP